VTSVETMNAMPLRPASLVVAASDGPSGWGRPHHVLPVSRTTHL